MKNSDGYPWELWVVPEDGNLEEVVNGFHAGMRRIQNGRLHVLRVTPERSIHRKQHGWGGALGALPNLHLQQRPKRHVLIVMDFDKDVDLRKQQIETRISELGMTAFRDRIHVLAVSTQSEDLLNVEWPEEVKMHFPVAGRDYDRIGQCFAFCCSEKNYRIFDSDPRLCWNAEELSRMLSTVCVNLSIPISEARQIRM